MHRELATAYAASLARVASWAVVTGMVYRASGANGLALIVLARATVGFFAYAGLGLGPALVTILPKAAREDEAFAEINAPAGDAPARAGVSSDALADNAVTPPPDVSAAGDVIAPDASLAPLDYAPPTLTNQRDTPTRPPRNATERQLLRGSRQLALIVFCVVALGGYAYAAVFDDWLHRQFPRGDAHWVIGFFAIGLGLRLMGDVAGAALQTSGRIAFDNVIAAATEAGWVVVFLLPEVGSGIGRNAVLYAAFAFVLVNLAATAVRLIAARADFVAVPDATVPSIFRATRRVVPTGLTITLAALADFLYAPMNLVLLSALTSTAVVAAYAPLLQIDAALLVLVGGLSAVLLPKAALAHGRADAATLRAYFVQGTRVSFILLAVAALFVCATGWLLLRLWLGTVEALTLWLLPFVLIHTVIGGASGVGRAVLLGMGKAKPLAASALIAGACNVALAWLLAGPTGLGVWGVVWATIFTVTLRCGVWMPWYVLRKMKESLVISH